MKNKIKQAVKEALKKAPLIRSSTMRQGSNGLRNADEIADIVIQAFLKQLPEPTIETYDKVGIIELIDNDEGMRLYQELINMRDQAAISQLLDDELRHEIMRDDDDV